MPLRSLDDPPAGSEILSRLSSLRDGTSALVALYDADDVLRYANRAFRNAFAVAPHETLTWETIVLRNQQTGTGVIIQSPDFGAWVASARSRRGKTPYRGFEVDMADGRWLWMTETTDADGWMLCVATDITELRIGDRALRQARDFALRESQTDDLTGVANRRFMMSTLETLSRAMADGTTSGGCVCLLDLDRFKRVNDTFGHNVGDETLIAFARFVQATIRRRDAFGRIGGEEFMLIFPDTTITQASGMVIEMLERVRAARLIPLLPSLVVTCSVGIAKLLPAETIRELYARVDRALYVAKNSGRDRLEIAA